MKSYSEKFLIDNLQLTKAQVLDWVNQFSICAFLDNNLYQSGDTQIECLAAADTRELFSISHLSDYHPKQLAHFFNGNQEWIFGHIAYDFKNHIYPLNSAHPDPIGFSDLCFFKPATIIEISASEITIISYRTQPAIIFEEIKAIELKQNLPGKSIAFIPRISKEAYVQAIDAIRAHIIRGDCYELNFCQEFYAPNSLIEPTAIFKSLLAISPNPFACYYRNQENYLLCASPERFLKKTGQQLLSQPMKGTIPRNLSDPIADAALKESLQQNEKERSENVMVVDLIRNDLSKVCKEGTVAVSELFGVYPFPQVHQMISTITGQLKPEIGFDEILAACFPMGSMTGAPKLRVMELIEKFEKTKRGLYSGTVGYIRPNGDFDFNVVIRSLLYNAKTQYLNYQVGSGITYNSEALKEYEECNWKASAIQKLISGN